MRTFFFFCKRAGAFYKSIFKFILFFCYFTVQKRSLESMSRSQHVLRVHSFVLGEKVVGLDDKFGGGNVITETLAAAVVTSAMPQNIASFSQLHPSGGREGGE